MSASRKPTAAKAPMALAGLGFELVAAVIGFTFVGYRIDRHFQTGPWGTVIGAILGIVGGLYNFLRVAMRAAGLDDENSADE